MELIGGAYSTRSPLGGAMRCVNLFPETNRKDGPQTLTHYQRPGLRALVRPDAPAPCRGLYRASNGNGYCCIGQNVYAVGPNFALTLLGQLKTYGTSLLSWSDNGTTILLVDNSIYGYSINMATNAFAQIIDPTGIFNGSNKVDILDGFLLWNVKLPDGSPTNSFGSTYDNVVTFDATYYAAKNGYPDLLASLYVNRHELLLFGTLKSEIWYDAGNSLFPFAELPGSYIEHGLLAPYSVAHNDISVFWLAQSLQGVGYILRQRGYDTKRISNYAISYAINQMKRNGADLSDAHGYCYSLEGHTFYVITFVSGDQTWVFDDSIGEPELAWHQRGWTDANGVLHRERANCHAYFNNTNVVGDWENGTIYALDNDYYFDDVGTAAASPISYIRTFPQVMMADGPNGPVMADWKSLQINRFTADLECGNGPLDLNGLPPSISLRVSFDRGKKWGQGVLQSTGQPGEYASSPRWTPLGVGRFPLLEVNYSFAGQAALNGGWIDAKVAAQ